MNIGENLKDKKIILTGGSRGIGLSILDKLYTFESKVLVIGSNIKNLLTIKEKYTNILIEQLNLEDHKKITENFSGYIEKLGGLDILVNNAGITKDNLAIRMNLEEWNQVINVNLTSSFLLSQQAIKFMIKNKVSEIYELGPGKSLSAMIKRFNTDIVLQNYNSTEEVNKLSNSL